MGILAALLAAAETIKTAVVEKNALQAALEGGGRDNITLVLMTDEAGSARAGKPEETEKAGDTEKTEEPEEPAEPAGNADGEEADA